MDLKQHLRNLPAFESYSPPHLDVLAGLLEVQNYPEGHVFTVQGQQGEAMYLLIEGKVRIDERDEIAGLVHDVKELHSGELFGLLSLLDNMPAAASCAAVTPVTAAAISRAAFGQLFQSAPPVGYQLQYMVAVQLARDLQSRNKSLRALLRREAIA
jgi:CRP-like cAMP-binding protein